MPYSRAALLLALLWLPVLALAADKVAVVIEGVEGELLNNVRAYLSLDQPRERPFLNEARVRQLFAQAPQEIEKALQALGFYHVRIRSDLSKKGDTWHARFRIERGPPMRISAVDLEITGPGAKDSAFQRYRVPFKAGDILDQGAYEKAKGALQELAAERGYLDAGFSQSQIQVTLQRNEARIVLHFHTGPRYRLGKVSFKQEEPVLRPELLARFVPFKPGEPYTSARISALQSALAGSEYFSSVEVRLLREQARGHEIPVEVTVRPSKKHRFSFGLGYGTDTGPRGTLDWKNRRVNTRGHQFTTTAELSAIRSSIIAAYEIPLARPVTDKLALQGGFKTENTDTSQSETRTVSLRRTSALRHNWLQTVYLDYQNETFNVAGDKRTSNMLLPGASWARTKADNLIYPTRGSRWLLELKGTDTALGSDTRLLQGHVQGKFIRSLGRNQRLLLRGELGLSYVSNFDALPATLRFFAGGDQSVRGYAYNSLGPEDASGEVTGGRDLVVGSVEYERTIKGRWGAAVFADAGNALNSLGDPLRYSVGVGARWRSPVGPVRVDLAVPLVDADQAVRLHISLGPDL